MKIDIKPILNLRKDGATSTLLIIKDLTILLGKIKIRILIMFS